MTVIDFTKLTPWQVGAITALATLLAAFVAAMGAYIVARVNAVAARQLAQDNARRDHLWSVAAPFLKRVEADCPRLVKAAQALASYRISGDPDLAVSKGWPSNSTDDRKKFLDAMGRLYKFNTTYGTVGPDVQSLCSRTEAMTSARDRLVKARAESNGTLMAAYMVLSEGPREMYDGASVREAVNEVLEATTKLRIAVEDFVYK